jgi:hypothetical protein
MHGIVRNRNKSTSPAERMLRAGAVEALCLYWEKHTEMSSTVCHLALCFPSLKMVCVSISFQIHETIETINQLKTQREFMLSFARDPQGFINDWLQSQCRDLKVKNLRKV